MAKRLPPLNYNSPIVDAKGRPTSDFILLVNQLLTGDVTQLAQNVEELDEDVTALTTRVDTLEVTVDELDDDLAILEEREIIAGTGLSGGGVLGDGDVTLNLADTLVTPGTYGDADNTPVVTVDQQGRITDITTVPTSGSGGGAGYLPLVDGGTPPTLIYLSDGSLVYTEVIDA